MKIAGRTGDENPKKVLEVAKLYENEKCFSIAVTVDVMPFKMK